MKKLIAAHILLLSLFAPAHMLSAQQPSGASPNELVSQGFSDVSGKSSFCTGGSCTYEPLEPLPYLPNKYGPENSFASAIPGIFKLLIGGGATIAVVMIVLGALTYMFSDIVGNKKKALDRIRGAMWAIVLLVSSYLILATINPDLVTFSLKLKTADNFMKSPDPIIDATPAQMTQDQYQAALNQCIQGGKTMRQRPDGTPICQ
jgi:hypothetical protein